MKRILRREGVSPIDYIVLVYCGQFDTEGWYEGGDGYSMMVP